LVPLESEPHHSPGYVAARSRRDEGTMNAQIRPIMHRRLMVRRGMGQTTLPRLRIGATASSRAGTPLVQGAGFTWRSMVARGFRGLGQDPITDYYVGLAQGDTSGGSSGSASTGYMPTDLQTTWTDTSGTAFGLDLSGNLWNLNNNTIVTNVGPGGGTIPASTVSGQPSSLGAQIISSLTNAGIAIGKTFASYANPLYNLAPGTYFQQGPQGTVVSTAGVPGTALTGSSMMPILLIGGGLLLVMMMGRK